LKGKEDIQRGRLRDFLKRRRDCEPRTRKPSSEEKVGERGAKILKTAEIGRQKNWVEGRAMGKGGRQVRKGPYKGDYEEDSGQRKKCGDEKTKKIKRTGL